MPKRDLVRRIDNEAAAVAGYVGGNNGGMVAHDLNGPYHTGILGDNQAPQFLMRDGSRSVSGDLPVDDGKKIDGVDLSNLAHRYILAGDGVVSDYVGAPEDPANGELLLVAPPGGGNANPRVRVRLAGDLPALDFAEGDRGLYVKVEADHGIDKVAQGLRVDVVQLAGGGLVPDTASGHWELDLGTPSTLSTYTANAVTADSHVHALIAYEDHYLETNRGHLLKSTEDTGRITVNIARAMGELRTPHIIWQGEEEGDGIIVQNITIEPIGDLVLDPTGEQVLPGGSVTRDLGAYNRLWRTLYVAQLYAYQLVAEDIMSTIGGYIRVAPTTQLLEDLAPDSQVMRVLHNQPRLGDYLVMQTAPGGIPQFEVFRVSGGPRTIQGGYEYDVVRNVANTLMTQVSHDPGSFDYWYYGYQPEQLESDLLCRSIEGVTLGGGVMWYKGDAVVNIGSHAGDGYIDLTSSFTVFEDKNPDRVDEDGVHVTHHGPSITFYVRRSGATWNDMRPMICLGNLDGLAGFGSGRMDSPDPVMGLALGKDLYLEPGLTPNNLGEYFQGLTLDYDHGLRLFNTDYQQWYWNAPTLTWRKTVELLRNGSVKFGENVVNPAQTGFEFEPATGDIYFGNRAGQHLQWDASEGKVIIANASLDGVDLGLTWEDIVNLYVQDPDPAYGMLLSTIIGDGYIVVGQFSGLDLTGFSIDTHGLRAYKLGQLQAAMTTDGEFVAGFDPGTSDVADHYVRLDSDGLTLLAPETQLDEHPYLPTASVTFQIRGAAAGYPANSVLGYVGAGYEDSASKWGNFVVLKSTIDSTAGNHYWYTARTYIESEHPDNTGLYGKQLTRIELNESGPGSSVQIFSRNFSLMLGDKRAGDPSQDMRLSATRDYLHVLTPLVAGGEILMHEQPELSDGLDDFDAYGRIYISASKHLPMYRAPSGIVSPMAIGLLDDIPDVEISSPQELDMLSFDATSGRWRNRAVAGLAGRPNTGAVQNLALNGDRIALPPSGGHFATGPGTLRYIDNGHDGDLIVLRAQANVETVVRTGGNIWLDSEYVRLNSVGDRLMLHYDASHGIWAQLTFSAGDW